MSTNLNRSKPGARAGNERERWSLDSGNWSSGLDERGLQ